MKKKNVIPYLCVDTNIFIQCCFLETDGDNLDVLNKLHKLLNDNKIKLLLPELIKLEFYKKIKINKESLIGAIIRHKNNISNSGDLNEKPKKDLIEILDKYIKEKEKLLIIVQKEIDSLFTHKNTVCTNLELTPQVFVEAYKASLTYEKPFKKDDRGDRLFIFQQDCLIIESLCNFFKSKSNYIFYLCTSNKKDFATEDKNKNLKIHDDIKKKFKNVIYYENLGKLLRDKFGVKFTSKVMKKLENKNSPFDSFGNLPIKIEVSENVYISDSNSIESGKPIDQTPGEPK